MSLVLHPAGVESGRGNELWIDGRLVLASLCGPIAVVVERMYWERLGLGSWHDWERGGALVVVCGRSRRDLEEVEVIHRAHRKYVHRMHRKWTREGSLRLLL